MKNNPFLYFDIETGGLDPSQHSILSISHALGDQRRSLYARPAGPMSAWVTENVWNPIRARIGGDPTHTEEQILRDFLGTLQAHRGGTIAGWNIGYVAAPMTKGSKGFDIPFIMSRAGRYGLEKDFGEAFGNLGIRDIGREFSVRIAQEVAKYPNLVDKDLHAQAQSFTKLININRATQRLHTVPEIAEWMGTPGKYGGFEVAGWKLSSIYRHLFGEELSGHHLSEMDILATKRIAEQGDFSKLLGQGFVSAWNTEALANKAAASARFAEGVLGGDFYARAGARLGANRLLKQGGSVLARHKWGIGLGLGAAALFAVKPLQYFSGKDDNYNTIEGLSHRGIAKKKRRELTDFGSGYQGDKKYERDVKERFRWFKKALHEYGQEVGTGHKRILIPKKALNEQQLKEVLGFVPVTVAIPEAGQKKFASFRHPDMNYHIHDHGQQWSMHEDRHAASTMLIKKWLMQRKGEIKQSFKEAKHSVEDSLFTPIKHLFAGIPHVMEEGIPGAYFYLRGQLLGGQTMLERLRQDLSPEYQKRVAQFQEIRQEGMFSLKRIGRTIKRAVISGRDDAYNTIEGLRHGGMAERKRKELTEFGSGWDPLRKLFSIGENFAIPEFQAALKAAKEISVWFPGGVPNKGARKVATMQGVFRGTPFTFMRKEGRLALGKHELAAMKAAEGTFGPTVYGSSSTHIDMEHFRGKTLGELFRTGKFSEEEMSRMMAAPGQLRVPGFDHGDISADNALFMVHEGKLRIGLIDYGRATPKSRLQRFLATVKSKFSGKDDEYNVIEGLGHGGLAEKIRHVLTDFGSGWIRRAISMGISQEKIMSGILRGGSGLERSNLKFALKTKQLLKSGNVTELLKYTRGRQGVRVGGQRYVFGQTLGSGGFGKVVEAYATHGARRGEKLVYKHMTQVEDLNKFAPGASFLGPGLMKHNLKLQQKIRNIIERGGDIPDSLQMQYGAFGRFTTEYTEAMKSSAASFGGIVGPQYEAAMQKKARAMYGEMVPDVLGTTDGGILMEYGGSRLPVSHKTVGSKFIEETWSNMYHTQGQRVVQLDPHAGNVLRKGARMRVVDWGASAEMGTTAPVRIESTSGFSRQALDAADDALATYSDSIQNAAPTSRVLDAFTPSYPGSPVRPIPEPGLINRERWLSEHKNAVIMASRNAKYGGKGHRRM